MSGEILIVIPGPATGRNPESRRPHQLHRRLDSGFAQDARPGMAALSA
jgi:hypothetical protein